MDKRLTITPLGGLNEVGRNLTVVAWGEERVVIDCGVGFPRGERRGGAVEQLLPDVSSLEGKPIAALLLTHGHDDHIAAIRHLIRSGAPIGRIIGTAFTINLVRAKLAEANVPHPPTMQVVPGQTISTGAFAAEWVRVSHSIPDAAAIVLSTPAGTVVFSGDYKLDDTMRNPRRRADKSRLAAVGRAGVLLLCGDSTNAPEPGRTPSEDSTLEPLCKVVEETSGRVIVTSFASNIDRVDHALRAADRTGRRVTLLGRSMRRNVEIAERLDEIDPPARPYAGPREMQGESGRRSLLVCTGSQAEEFAVLARAARGEHPFLHINGADTIVFAARPVPGNEIDVAALQAALARRGAKIITRDEAPGIHVSGHARSDEIAEMIDLLRPRFLVPLHGERHMLEAQSRIATQRCGMPTGNVLIARNGDVIAVDSEGIEILERTAVGVVYADADGDPLPYDEDTFDADAAQAV